MSHKKQSPPLPPRLLTWRLGRLLVHANYATALHAPEVLTLPTRLIHSEASREHLRVQRAHCTLRDAIFFDQVGIDFFALLVVLAIGLNIQCVQGKRVACTNVTT